MPLQPMSDNFDVNVDWEHVPDSDLIPESTYELMVKSAEMGWTATEKLAVELTYEVGAGELEGKRLRPETFTLGDDQDNKGMNPETRMKLFGWMNLKKICNAVGVRYEQSLRATTHQLEGKRFLGVVKVVTQPDKNRDGTPNQYAGQQQNRITAYYPLGHTLQVGGSIGVPSSANGMVGQQGAAPQPQRRMSAMEALLSQREQQAEVSQVGDVHEEVKEESDETPL